MTDADLKPCPLCGETQDAGVYLQGPTEESPFSAYVRCSQCNLVQCQNNEAEAIAAWNLRALSPPAGGDGEVAPLASLTLAADLGASKMDGKK